MVTVLAGGQVIHGAVAGLLSAGDDPAPGENPGGYGLAGLIIEVLERVGWTAGIGLLGVLVTLAGATWAWRRESKVTGEERRRTP
ncbi:hypothetical protein [Streptomyces sp. NPDC093111]|uniref:hypothetical protein n=1 Tax=Streptomyces sp. NPDC093111 TaxID=3154978 RepID=UPI003435980A